MTSYTDDLATLVEAFEFELCDVCGRDLDRHIISPDMFGKPHLWCVEGED